MDQSREAAILSRLITMLRPKRFVNETCNLRQFASMSYRGGYTVATSGELESRGRSGQDLLHYMPGLNGKISTWPEDDKVSNI